MENTSDKYIGYGVHHNALGVKSLDTMRAFYRDILEFNTIFCDFPRAHYPALNVYCAPNIMNTPQSSSARKPEASILS
jgi:catechol-2,3-dioxygenase